MNQAEYQKSALPAELARQLATPFWQVTLETLRSMCFVRQNTGLPVGVITSNGIAIGASILAQERVFQNLAELAGHTVPSVPLPIGLVIPPEDATE